MKNLEQTIQMINSGKFLSIAADESALNKLPKGNWIGGTIAYFMSSEGGKQTKEEYFIHEIPEDSLTDQVRIKAYSEMELDKIISDEPENGFSWIIIPAFSSIHTAYARNIPTVAGVYNKPLVGWISGLHLDDLGKTVPKVYNGQTGQVEENKAIVMHVPLTDKKYATLEILNLFSQGKNDVITFDEEGFEIQNCFVNGEKQNFSEYLTNKKIDLKLPLVTDLYGVMVNTSFQANDEIKKKVQLYAPVFKGLKYKVADEVPNYTKAFLEKIPSSASENAFSCNCILNYLYGELNGKKTGNMKGPMTFGEIAYILLNQTLVYMEIKNK